MRANVAWIRYSKISWIYCTSTELPKCQIAFSDGDGCVMPRVIKLSDTFILPQFFQFVFIFILGIYNPAQPIMIWKYIYILFENTVTSNFKDWPTTATIHITLHKWEELSGVARPRSRHRFWLLRDETRAVFSDGYGLRDTSRATGIR